MPSTQTRAKLKQFQFAGGDPAIDPVNPSQTAKENILPVQQAKAMPKPNKAGETTRQTAQTPDHNIATRRICPPPSTPVTRLPLAELVGNVDSSDRHILNHAVSPEEQLCWRGSQPINTPLPRKRRRARSSSPVAPSQDDQKPQEPATKEMRTPQADPAVELWNRYANNKGTPSRKNVAFAHLIGEASPRSFATAGSVSGLRRWASCGLEFPTSTRKKRKIVGTFEPTQETSEDVFGPPSSDGVFHDQGETLERSKLTVMMQKMRDSMPDRHDTQVPSSSSPLPNPDRPAGTAINTPLQGLGCTANNQEQYTTESLSCGKGSQEVCQHHVEVERASFGSSSDEFGDPDMEAAMANGLDTSSQRSPKPIKIQECEPVQMRDAFPHTGTNWQTASQPTAHISSDDEFGLGGDLDAADLEHVASLYDCRSEASPRELQSESVSTVERIVPPGNIISAPPVISLVDDDDDDFGDDIDADEFAAAEIAATQASATTVRRSS